MSHKGAIARKSVCSVCGKDFVCKQNNPNLVSTICLSCKTETNKCRICGKNINIDSNYCSRKCANSDTSNLKNIIGHKKQGEKIKGQLNPAKRIDVRKKISEGVKKSYNTELKKIRAISLLKTCIGKHSDGKGNMLRSTLELAISKILQKNEIEYIYEKYININGINLFPDFYLQNGTLVEVMCYLLDKQEIKRYKLKIELILRSSIHPLIVVTYGKFLSVFENLKSIRDFSLVSLDEDEPKIETICLENIDTIDYGHVLPFHPAKCSQLHAHSSLVASVEVCGYVDPHNYMVVDFGIIKTELKKILSLFDHHLVIGRKYIKEIKENTTIIEFETKSGLHSLTIPSCEVMIIETEATIEEMSFMCAKKLISQLPTNIFQVVVKLSEGIGKSASAHVGNNFPEYKLGDLTKIILFYESFPMIYSSKEI